MLLIDEYTNNKDWYNYKILIAIAVIDCHFWTSNIRIKNLCKIAEVCINDQ